MGILKTRSRKRHNAKRHRWNLKESLNYLHYLQQNSQLFLDTQTKKQHKVYVNIAKAVKTRSKEQVKSHHQKMMIKYGSIPKIIISLIEEQEIYTITPTPPIQKIEKKEKLGIEKNQYEGLISQAEDKPENEGPDKKEEQTLLVWPILTQEESIFFSENESFIDYSQVARNFLDQLID